VTPQDRRWDDLLGPDRDPAEVIEDTKRLLGLDARKVRYGDGLPGVRGWLSTWAWCPVSDEGGLGLPQPGRQKQREADRAEARIEPPLVDVYLTVGVRTSDGPGPGRKRVPPGEAPRWSATAARSTATLRRAASATAARSLATRAG
jgi:hypothetical protein